MRAATIKMSSSTGVFSLFCRLGVVYLIFRMVNDIFKKLRIVNDFWLKNKHTISIFQAQVRDLAKHIEAQPKKHNAYKKKACNYLRWRLLFKYLRQYCSIKLFCNFLYFIWDKVFTNGRSKICGREPLKNLKWCSLLGRPYHFKFFKGFLLQILLGPFFNTLFHMIIIFCLSLIAQLF